MNPSVMSQETEILSRVIGPQNPSFTVEAARSILALRFNDADIGQVNALAEKARHGLLSEEEDSQLQAYLFVGAVLDLMHSKARLSLKNHAASPDG
jgi:hypothetical protein